MSRMRVKPSKSQSVIGFFVGFVFIFIGIGTLSKTGFFGIFWTLMAVVITVMHGINAFSEKGISTMTIEDDFPSNNTESRLKKLESLRSQNLITLEEYEEKRKEILESL